MKKILTVWLISTSILSSFAQSGYKDILNWGKVDVFKDDFVDNRNKWYLYNNEYKTNGRIENGYYFLQVLDSVSKIIRHEILINPNSDFEIEASIKFVKGNDNAFIGMCWSRKDVKNYYLFGFSGNGYYRVNKLINDEWVPILKWVKSPLVKTKDYNKLTIRKVDNTYCFFLNEELVHSMPYEPLMGNWMGFEAPDSTIIYTDYWNVKTLICPQPSISWISPQTVEQSQLEEYIVKAKITSLKTISNLLLFVNDFPVPASKDDLVKIENDYYFQKKVALNSGNNSIVLKVSNGGEMVNSKPAIIAYGSVSNTSSNQIGISKTVANQNIIPNTQPAISIQSDVDIDIPVNPSNPKRFALVIGNEDYSSYQKNLGAESNVRYAINDATAFKMYAQKVLGLEERNIFFLTNATAGTMNQKIELVTKIISKMNGMAELFFYYAGHGFPDEETRMPYLIPVDVNIININQGIKLSDLYEKLNSCGAKRVSVILDACFSGGGREGGLVSARGVRIKPREDEAVGNIVVFTACSGEQSSLPFSEKGHGMFTYYFLKKLKDCKGKVSYKDMFDYLKENVSIESLRTNYKEQDPQLNSSPNLQKSWEGWVFAP
ncbi:MAG: caspase family protein [Bacteroidales bacterium]|nr:caspase family protein [Bacteroidales bacterium]